MKIRVLIFLSFLAGCGVEGPPSAPADAVDGLSDATDHIIFEGTAG